MAEFLVSGYYGDKNAGDEAILAGIVRSVRELDPGATFTVISKKAAHTRRVHGVSAVSRNDFKNTWRAVQRADMLISGGGSLLQDVTSTKSLFYYLGIMMTARAAGRPVMAYAQGIGPLHRRFSQTAVAAVLNRINLISVRDNDSAAILQRLGVKRPTVAVTADPALALGPSDPEWGAQLLAEAGAEKGRPVIGVSVRPWRREGAGPWEVPLGKALDRIAGETGAHIAFLPMQQPHDVEAAQTVAAHMESQPLVVTGEFDHTQVQAMIAACHLIVGMRFHALVFAAMNGVPLVGLSYDPKNDSFLRQMGDQAVGGVNPGERLDADRVAAAARAALEGAAAHRERLLGQIATLTPLARRNAQLAVDLLRHREAGR